MRYVLLLLALIPFFACADIPRQPDDPNCQGSEGPTCPPSAGNCKGVGAPCTKGGHECDAAGNGTLDLQCDVDLSSDGAGMCITVFDCHEGKNECGTNATCCDNLATKFVAVCLPNQCLAKGCKAE